MKILLIFCILLGADLLAQDPFVVDHKNEELYEEFERLNELIYEYEVTGKEPAPDEIKMIEVLYHNEGSSQWAIDVKAYAFSALVLFEGIERWSPELSGLLSSESRQPPRTAIAAVYYVFKKGTEKEKVHLLGLPELEDQMRKAAERSNDSNVVARVSKISKMMDQYDHLLDTSEAGTNLSGGGHKADEQRSPDSRSTTSNEKPEGVLGFQTNSVGLWLIVGVTFLGVCFSLFKVLRKS